MSETSERAGQMREPRGMTPPVRFGVAHDFRRPPGSDYSLRDAYAQTIDQIARLDELGLDEVWFSEHHFVDDGYLPSFAPVAGAAAAVTKRMRISTNIAIVPFSHPLRLAEDLAVLDQLSGGRIEFGVASGTCDTSSAGRPSDLASCLAHRGVCRHPPPGVVGRALQLRRKALPLRRRACDARPSPAGRPTAVDGGVEPARSRTSRPPRDACPAPGPRVASRRVARAKSRCRR